MVCNARKAAVARMAERATPLTVPAHVLMVGKASIVAKGKDYYIDGLFTLAVKIGTMSAEGGPTWNPNYTPTMIFLQS